MVVLILAVNSKTIQFLMYSICIYSHSNRLSVFIYPCSVAVVLRCKSEIGIETINKLFFQSEKSALFTIHFAPPTLLFKV